MSAFMSVWSSPKDALNSSVFSCRLSAMHDDDVLTESGRAFQARAAAEGNARWWWWWWWWHWCFSNAFFSCTLLWYTLYIAVISAMQVFERILYIWAIRHPASGYVQGINDLVTPFFVVFLSEYLSDGQSNAGYFISHLLSCVSGAAVGRWSEFDTCHGATSRQILLNMIKCQP